jgi:hypothetical protein
MAPRLTYTEENEFVEVELLGQVQSERQVLLSASDDCMERARRHFRNVLRVFSNFILNDGTSDRTKAARYLRLRRRLQNTTAMI